MGTEELQAFLGENTLEVKGAVNDEALLTAVPPALRLMGHLTSSIWTLWHAACLSPSTTG